MAWHLTSCDSYSRVGSSCAWRQKTTTVRRTQTLVHQSKETTCRVLLGLKAGDRLALQLNVFQLFTGFWQLSASDIAKKGHLDPEMSEAELKRTPTKGYLSCVSGCGLRKWIGDLGFLLKFPFHFLRQEVTTQGSVNHSFGDSLKFIKETGRRACCHYDLLISKTEPPSDVVCLSIVTHTPE